MNGLQGYRQNIREEHHAWMKKKAKEDGIMEVKEVRMNG